MRFGSYDCFTVVMDSFLLDGGAMFGVVPKNLWEKKIPADDSNRIPMQARSLVIRGNGRIILVDTGIGDKLPARFNEIYGIQTAANSMAERLAPFELTVDDFTDVILTHLHFDHAGGSTTITNGKVVPTFPNAVYHIQQAQWELACNPSVRDLSSYIQDNFMPLLEQKVLHLINGPIENFFDGIDLIVTDGHSRGQQHPLIKGDKKSLFFCADLIPTSAHIPTAWHMGYDNHPLNIMDEKDEILSRALEENWVLCFEHDPVVAAASIREDKGRAVIDRVIEL
ncbi:MAG: MBL fold metallo-hydrolase [Desulfobacteraceae bacterium]|nr:MBL fold metallo-hydrolase [Desulfobacteraceae bacterium]MBC2756422.1 MBL fold metallo-hydrolase [Desulfobacteraceae bacterium]